MDEEITNYLCALEREQCYRVEETLKSSDTETTQKVYFVGKNGCERGPYIRKYFSSAAGLGNGYKRIYDAQRKGRRFAHIPRVMDIYALDDSTEAVVLEFTEGETIEEMVARIGGSAELARQLFPAICDAVIELHSAFDPPLIHRDIKPSNVVVKNGFVTVIDFGIARSYSEGSLGDTTHFGTKEYAPPEQFGFGQTDERSDVYALGMLLYFMLTGNTPSKEARENDFLVQGVPEDMSIAVMAATMIDPSQRFQSVSAFREYFVNVSKGEQQSERSAMTGPIAAAPPTPAPSVAAPQAPAPYVPVGAPAPRKVTTLNIIIFVVLAFFFAVSLGMVFFPEPSDPYYGYPLAARFFSYLPLTVLMFPGIGYLVSNKAALGNLIPPLARLQRSKADIWIAIAAIVLGVVLICVTGSIYPQNS